MYFLESSAWIKLFIAEVGSPGMVRLVEASANDEKAISTIAFVEVRSAIRRRERAGDISAAHAVSAIASLSAELRRVVEHQVTPTLVSRAAEIIDRHVLRTLDALQLPTALLASENLSRMDRLTFVCSDHKLLEAAENEGLSIWNPEAV